MVLPLYYFIEGVHFCPRVHIICGGAAYVQRILMIVEGYRGEESDCR